MNDLFEWIKRLPVRHDIPVFGIAGSLHLENDTPGYRPSDLLRPAESIVCLGLPVPKGIWGRNPAGLKRAC